MRRLASRIGRFATEGVTEIYARAGELQALGHSLVHLEIGEPDVDTPASISEAAIAAIRAGDTHYTPPAGIPELRAAIARYVTQRRGLTVHAGEVVATAGAKPVLFYTILALLEEGDECIVPDPGFPFYESIVNFVGGRVVRLPLREENAFEVDVNELASLITARTKLMIVNSPHNPTGSTLSQQTATEIAQIACEHDLWVLSDEIYSEVLFDVAHVSIWAEPAMRERTILLDGFSKTFAMAGWRLGYAVLPEPLREPMTKLVRNSVSCSPAFTQRAAVAALERRPGEVDRMLSDFRIRRDRLIAGLNLVPKISCSGPRGGYYAFANVKGLGLSARACAHRLLDEAGVVCLPGTAFGPMGEGYLRLFCLAEPEETDEAIRRLAKWVRGSSEDQASLAAPSRSRVTRSDPPTSTQARLS